MLPEGREAPVGTVIITGISRGIGLGLAARYLERGDLVVGIVRAANDAVAALQRDYGDRLIVATADVTDARALDAAARGLRQRVSAADVLVCNAAINPQSAGRSAAVGDLSDDDLSASFDGQDRHGRRQRAAHGSGINRADRATNCRAPRRERSLYQPHRRLAQVVGAPRVTAPEAASH